MTEIEDQAVLLRKQGLSYKEISSTLNGALSVDQLKRKLKGVLKGDQNEDCLKALIHLASRPEGVSVYEANGVIMKHNEGKDLTKEQMRYLRDKAKTLNPKCLFRQGWVSPSKPQESYQAFCAHVLHMQDEIDNLIRWYCDSFPDTNKAAVKWELLEYLKPSKDSLGLGSRISKAEILTEQMQQRLLDAEEED